MRLRVLAYLGVVLLLLAFAALEFFVEYRSGNAPDAALCLTPESKKDAIKDVLFHHMIGH